MDIGVTLEAGPTDHEAVVRRARVPGVPVRVTLLAKPWERELEHGVPRRAVGLVAVEAVLVNGRVLPEEGTALLRVPHDPEVATRCRRGLHMVDGRIVEQGAAGAAAAGE